MTGYAYFVKRPRTIDDLCQPHLIESERPFIVVKEIILAGIDYTNFATDMVADRQFLEDNAKICSKDTEVVRCLLIKQRRTRKGILVVPDKAWIDIAALLVVN